MPLVLNDTYFNPSLVKRLNDGGDMEKGDKSKILNGGYDYITTLVLYPSPGQYNEMAMSVLRKWPATAQGLSIENAKVSYLY